MDHVGTFAGFILLSEKKWDKKQFIRDLAEKWGITAKEEENKSDDALVFSVDNMIAAVSLMPEPIPDREAELNAENNYMWPKAVETAKAHKAHIMVAVLGQDEDDLLERGKLYTKLAATCCRQKYATGVYTSGVVFEPRFYEGFADMMQEDELPIFNWIWFGLYRSEKGVCGYTYGMDVFGKEEMEVLDADAEPSEVRDFLAGLATYVLEGDTVLRNGETIGFSADDKHAITRSTGVALPDQMTLKIAYTPDRGNQGQDDAPSELAQAMMDYLGCECQYFPAMQDDAPIMAAYNCAKQEGVVPMLVKVDDILWECLIMNSAPDHADALDFDPDQVAEYRQTMLAQSVEDGKDILAELVDSRRQEMEEDDQNWEELLGEMKGGCDYNHFSSYRDWKTKMTCPLILAKIPVKNPWEVFAYLPFGAWNECPDTPELMAAAKYWFEQYGAVPAVLTHDELEFVLPEPISEEKAMEVAEEQYGFCPDMDQNMESIGMLADTLRQSSIWYFWWD